jgi:prepilin-type N-terminal cleavage/methylation domain-containing protein/prepilin-type processing-associated H-X9-DG protein
MRFRSRRSRYGTALAEPSAATERSGNGFTIVELLVVIAIIALLLSILLPGLNKAMAEEQTAGCLSNLRQLQMALSIYIQDNFGHTAPYMPTGDNGGSFWHAQQLTPYYTGRPYAANNPSNTGNSVRLCPAAAVANPDPIGVTGQGLAFYCWGPSGAACESQTCSYEYNGYLYYMGTQYGRTISTALSNQSPDQACETQVNTSAIPNSAGVNVQSYFWQVPNIGSTPSSAIPTICDGIWVDTWPCELDPTPEGSNINLFIGSETGGSKENMGRVCISRHNLGKFINVAFLDGHAETVALRNLWALPWHRNWQTPNPLPQP